MGRSKNKTRSFTSNQRLRSVRSDSISTYNPSPVAYGALKPLSRRDLSSPLSFTPSQPKPRAYGTSRTYGSTRRSDEGRSYRRSTVPQNLWTPTPTLVSEAPKVTETRQTMVCVDRQQRREVLHALRKTGKSGQKRPEYNWKSKVHCKKR